MKVGLRFKVLFYLILILVLIFYVVFKEKGIIDYFKLENKFQELVKENSELEKENKKLKEIIEKLKNDKNYIEKIAREKYNMIKTGEILIKIKDNNSKGGIK